MHLSLALFGLMFLIALLLIGLLLIGRRGPVRESRASLSKLIVGALLVAVVVGAELTAIYAPTPAGDDALLLRVEAAPDDSALDRIQVLCLEADVSNVVRPDAIHVRTVPLPGDGVTIELEVEPLGTDIELTWSARREFDDPRYEVRTWAGNHFMRTSGQGLGRTSLDLGDGRPFRSVVFAQPVGAGLRLREVPRRRFSVWLRPLQAGDGLVGLPAAEVAARVSAGLRDRAVREGPSRGTADYPERPVARLLTELAPIGTLLFLAGLALMLFGRVAWIRGVALMALLLVVTTGVSARIDVSRAATRLGAGPPDRLEDTAARLAASRAFPRTASEALAAAYDREEDPIARAVTLLLTADDGNPMRTLPAARRMRDAAAGSSDETLRALAARMAAFDDGR